MTVSDRLQIVGITDEGMRGSNQSGMRAWNERLVLSLVRRHGALAKADIARLTGLSAQTVSVIMRALEQDGLLTKGEPQRGRVGQPLVPMSLRADGAFFLGLKIGRRSSEMVLVDFLGQIRGRHVMRHAWPEVGAVLRFATEAIARLTALLTPQQAARIAGLGIAMPFQLWDWAPLIGAPQARMNEWRDVDMRALLATACDFPVFLENDATAACGAELVFGPPLDTTDFAYFYIGYFIGGGLVLNGRLYSGRSGNAGALGSLPVPAPDGRMVQLIDLASIAVLERALDAAGQSSAVLWQDMAQWPIDQRLLADWIEGVARALTHGIAACVAVIDFDLVLIDGWMPLPVRQQIVARTRALLADYPLAGVTMPRLAEGSLGSEARSLGAASRPLAEKFLVDPNAMMMVAGR